MDNLFSLNGKKILVTGASSGIGLAFVEAYAKSGAIVAFNDLNKNGVSDALNYLNSNSLNAFGYVCDVTDEEQVINMKNKIVSEIGKIDILVNNAGIIIRKPMCEMNSAEFNKVIDVNLTAPFIMCKTFLPDMINNGGGKIINICSMMSELGRETVSAYASSKGGLKMLTKNIASEYGQYNIQCNGIGPGYISTAATLALQEPLADGSANPFDTFIKSKTPANRWGNVSDLVGPAIFLASKASDFVNGHILYVDGGILSYIGKQTPQEI